ncbi:MAG TPA: PQQ-binding-like beta-propeller repeat protein [Ktedonobacterales bacterium]|nr:PQQ-binding-like beta-propeller repeat protein [Ktedonobacterales bacterium]
MSRLNELMRVAARLAREHVFASAVLAVTLVAMVVATAGATLVTNQRLNTHTTTPPATVIAQVTGTPATPAPRPTRTPRPAPPHGGNDWTQYRYDVFGTGVNPETHFTTANVATLAQSWAPINFSGHPWESTPAVFNGTIYVTNGNALQAIDLKSGKPLWHFDDVPQTYATISSSVGIDPASKIAYYGTPDARVYAVSLVTHQQVWMQQLGDPTTGAFIWGSPLIINNMVYIGLASHDDNPCIRGGFWALNAATGATNWAHYTVDANTIGGSVWSSITSDPGKHQLIVTTSNPCPDNNVVGEEDSILAVDWDTGATIWQYQTLQTDACDCDFGEGAVIFTLAGTEYIVAGSKLGRVYALVPPSAAGDSPQVAWTADISDSQNNDLGQGGIFEPPTYANGIVYFAGGPTLDGACSGGGLWAFKADTGALAWRQCTAGQVASPSAYTNGVLFVGQADALVAYDAANGKVLWQGSLHVDGQPPDVWGGVCVSHGYVLVGSVSGYLHAFSLNGR